MFAMTWEVFSLAMLTFSTNLIQVNKLLKKVGFDIFFKFGFDTFENCNQKCQEEVSSKTLYQGMDIIQNRLLKSSKFVF